MKPVRLEMHGFGPYARSQTLDFRELGDRPLFLIHGPTGAGKSSILDAICVALYGETSGDERKGNQMRSDHAAPDHQTRVVFSFSIGGMIYMIDRTPGQDVLRRDGSGYRPVPQKVSMFEQAGEDDEPRLIASRVTEVGEQVERLLGLRADQFRQVVVLPQGRFRELLTASSNEREKIFSTLFQTHHYRLIQDRLKDRAREIRQGLDQLSERERLVLETHEVGSPEALREKVGQVDAGIGKLANDHASQSEVAKRARTELDQARETDRKLTDVENARKALSALNEREEEVKQQRTALDMAKRAATLADAEKFLTDRLEEAKASEETRDEIERKLTLAAGELESAQQEKQQADELKPQLDQFIARQGELERLRPRIVTLGEAETQANDAREAARKLSEQHDQLMQQQTEVDNALEQVQQQLQSARLQAGQVSGHEATLNQLRRLVRQRGDLDKYRADLRDERESQDAAVTALETAGARLGEAQRELDRLEQAWRDGQSAVLARQLEDEQPCPVCGSIHHPAPASSEQEIPDDADLEAQRQAVDSARNNRDQASTRKVAIDGRVESLIERVGDLENELGDQVGTPLDQLQSQRDEVGEQHRIAKDEAGKVESLDKAVNELVRNREELITQITDSERARNDARAAEVSTKTSFENAAREVPEDYRSLEALDAALEVMKTQVTDLTERIENAKAALETANSTHQTISTQLTLAWNEAVQDRKKADDADADFARRRREQGFADDDAYRAAQLPAGQVDQLDAGIREYDTQVSNANHQMENAEKLATGLQKPDLEHLETALTTAETKRDELFEQLTTLRSRLDHLQKAARQLLEIAGEKDTLNKQYEVAEYLSAVANGDSGYSMYKVSFERFVLSAFLDEVLDYATHRLYKMTSGRYRLLRKTEGGDRRRSTGLDLEIEDAWTGVSRDVSTLSGGEGFLAALAMALGLSEVVQSRSGGIRLQTLFVDEGFGSLDPDALDRSLSTLVDLQHGRLVGIISHVPELQERIDARLMVEAGKNGSHARFVL